MRQKNITILLICIGICFVLGLVAYRVVLFGRLEQPQIAVPIDPETPALSEQELLRVVELKTVGIAYLENHQWREGAAQFQQLLELIPNSEIAYQNLAIAQSTEFLNLDTSASPDTATQMLQAALLSISKLRSARPQSAISFRLEARLEEKQSRPDKAVQLLLQAAQLIPNDPVIWYEVYRTSQASHDPEVLARGRDALNKLHTLLPENVFGFLQWMAASLQDENAPVAKIIAELEALITPLAPGIQKRKGYDVLSFLERAKLNLQQGQLAAAKAGLAPIKNIIIGDDVSRSDREVLDIHPLAFIQLDFPKPLEQQLAQLSHNEGLENLAVTFEIRDPLIEQEETARQVQFADLNLDGNLELVVLADSVLQVFTRDAATEQWNLQSELTLEKPAENFLLLDFDYDLKGGATTTTADETTSRHTADLDLICYGAQGVQLFINTLAASGAEVAFEAIAPSAEMAQLICVSRIIAADLNSDGDLDLAIIAQGKLSYWNNLGNIDFALEPLDPQVDQFHVVDCLATDWDRDIDLDLILLFDDGRLSLLENHRHGTFRWISLDQKYQGTNPHRLELFDADRNGSWDLIVSGDSGVEVFSTLIPSTGQVHFTKSRLIHSKATSHFLEFDYDNDGLRDLVCSTASGVSFLQGGRSGEFQLQENLLKSTLGSVKSLSLGDFDNDGDDDLAIVTEGTVKLLVNQGGNQNSWIDVALLAARVEDDGSSGSQRINHYGFGSLIEVRAGTDYQQMLVRSPVSRFGLGSKPQADAVRVIWTNGIPQNVVQPATQQTLWEVQKLLGSCPYLYTWNGERFEFVTDLLWAAPIGLQNPQGELVPCRPWEYLKIPGELLQQRDGKYVLQITEELWEVAYFDQIELLAVDHPAEVDIYSNEKVGPPAIAEFQLHQVRNKQRPVSVINHQGEDLLPAVAVEDQNFAKQFTKRLTQGYTDECFVEIDFGLQKKPDQLTLFLTGWVRPTDCGLNVALHENTQLPGPTPPSILAPNAQGKFVEVIPYCGFPGGKTKTIAIDLSDVFLCDDYRIRLATSMELYWDHIFFSTEVDDAELIVQSLSCSSADLHERGVSSITTSSHNGPEQFDYQQTITAPAWPAIEGNFTRFGDVLDLVTKTDNQLVVMGTGDELTLIFDPPQAPLRPGWKRDFILHSVGWDKDANLHTVTGQTVEPLPFVEMSRYPVPEAEATPHPQDYLQHYQTRQMNPNSFRTFFRRSSLPELEATQQTQPQ